MTEPANQPSGEELAGTSWVRYKTNALPPTWIVGSASKNPAFEMPGRSK